MYLLLISYIWWLQFRFRPLWVVILGAVIGSHLVRREAPAALGFRLDGLRSCTASYGLLVLALAAGPLVPALVLHSWRPLPVRDVLVILAGYCLWGLFQQYVLNAYFVNRFAEAFGGRGAARSVTWLAAALFAGVHVPNLFLMAVTFCTGYLSARIYLKHRNLYFLGLAHALIGTALYLAVPDSISHHFVVGPAMAGR